jgi:hypothetical protein
MLGLLPIYALAWLEWQSILFRMICDRSVAIAPSKLRGLNNMEGDASKSLIVAIVGMAITLAMFHLLSPDFRNQYRYRPQQIERIK